MKSLVVFFKQISKSVLPYYYINIINNPYVRLFRFTACVSIITLFMCKSSLSFYLVCFLSGISYSYVFYQCTIASIKIYHIHSAIMTTNTKSICGIIRLSHIKMTYNVVVLILVLIGLPIVTDTILEIIGDVNYIIKQILEKKKK